jgi:hypothetical protein
MIFLGINGWGVEVNISSPEKLKEFLKRTFPNRNGLKKLKTALRRRFQA